MYMEASFRWQGWVVWESSSLRGRWENKRSSWSEFAAMGAKTLLSALEQADSAAFLEFYEQHVRDRVVPADAV
jgi:hypothetical protein